MRKPALTFMLLCALLMGCDAEKELPPPNIVWMTSEDNSKHYLKLFDENGVETPNLAKLAARGIKYTRAFSNAPVCSVARSTLISGCYGPRVGSQYHRKLNPVPLPEGLDFLPNYLREVGYYTANNVKEDYNFQKDGEVWHESSREATWKNRAPGQPFFYMINTTVTHEGRLHFSQEVMDSVQTQSDPSEIFVFPNHPQTDLFRYTNAYYRDKIIQMDDHVGDVLAELDEAGLRDSTVIFYFGDHGGVLPGSKGYIYESGLHIPLIVSLPPAYRDWADRAPGSENATFVSFVDFAATVLNLVGLDVPIGMDGKPFLGPKMDWDQVNRREETFAYADRFDEKYDLVRSIRKGRYKYLRNYQPFNVDGLMNQYRYRQKAYRQWWDLYQTKQLNDVQSAFFQPRTAEQLFDLEQDPYETINLAESPEHQEVLVDLRDALTQRVKSLPDLSFFPEHVLINEAFTHPTQFGSENKQKIGGYIDLANCQLRPFEEVKDELEKALSSPDPWMRYWALTVCSAFEREALPLAAGIADVAATDDEPLNRARAAQFLGITRSEDPSQGLLSALYGAADPAEALVILNMITLMCDFHDYNIQIDLSMLPQVLQEDSQVQRRLRYLAPDSFS
ncbi:MAG: sulfatase-like hydrolase/transferase [Bacteroidota bacterium]